MKILQIDSHYNQSGAGKVIKCISDELIKRGHESLVLYGRGRVSEDKVAIKCTGQLENYIDALSTRILGLNGYTCYAATKRIINQINKFDPDIIHLHALHGYYVNFKLLMNYILRIDKPCVWTFHDCLAFTGKCGYYYDCMKWKTKCQKCPLKADYPNSLFFDFSKKMFEDKKKIADNLSHTVIVSPSEWMTQNARESFFGRMKCITINNGVNTDEIFYVRSKQKCREKLELNKVNKIALAVSHDFNDERKGAKFILEFAKRIQGKDILLLIIGWNRKDDYRIKDLRNIITINYVSNQNQLAEYYSASDVFLMPSIEENYATVALEAIACGTPVVAFKVGGTPEIVCKNRGIAVERGNTEEFCEAAISILEERVKLSSRDQLGEEIAMQNSSTVMAEKYINLYKQLMGETNV